MIQRIQSVFLLLAIAVCGAVLYFPLLNIQPATGAALQLKAADSIIVQVTLAVLIITGLGALLLYKNRPLQSRIAMLGGLISLALFAGLLVFPGMLFKAIGTLPVKQEIGAWLVIGIDTFFFMAMLFIRKDEKLVRSADRIR
ncbi:MAG: hypothetical protein FD123_4333 [Bacteroidetes bacterium]|nr:MAG: hypothetical protein FD123_4333 [Bacteroidota bacterium]